MKRIVVAVALLPDALLADARFTMPGPSPEPCGAR